MYERPPRIIKAMSVGDAEHLQNAGRKGGEATARKRDIENAHADLAREIKELEEWQRKLSTNEHIVDPDGNHLDYLSDED
ncbi:MAG: hypothetical protein KBC62_02185 [Candidatus Pacebacteria bacterium]|nr:hypothetical protein [Candidatus Paceibacterota bacterium]MBP9842791.1 hypothetical protein [Candidatus Paceibacterota bacterium]